MGGFGWVGCTGIFSVGGGLGGWGVQGILVCVCGGGGGWGGVCGQGFLVCVMFISLCEIILIVTCYSLR